MNVYAHYDADTSALLAYYGDDQYVAVGSPAPSLVLTPEQHASAVLAGANAVEGGALVHRPLSLPPPTVDELLARIDAEAEAVRAQYITPGSGQAMVYGAKQAEARAYQAAGEPADLADYPLIAAEVGTTAPTAAEIAALWLAMEAQWVQAAAAIEALRLSAKAAVREAAPEDREAAAVVAWPSP